MTIDQLLDSVTVALSEHSGRTYTKAYTVSHNLTDTAAPDDDGIFRLVLPGETLMERPGRGGPVITETVAVLYLGLVGMNFNVGDILTEMRTEMRHLLYDGGPLRSSGATSRNAKTLNGCTGGYVASALASDSPQLMGGWQVSFWSNG